MRHLLYNLGLMDSVASYLSSPDTLVFAAQNPLDLMRAMRMHVSQFVWYRKLFVAFARYTYVNTLRQLNGTLAPTR